MARGEDDRGAENQSDAVERRTFLGATAFWSMVGGLVAGYGAFAAFAGRFLFPSSSKSTDWQFVATVDQLQVGESMDYEAPSGDKVVVARQNEGGSSDAFIALSSVCPHLGCQVHWESVNDRFFCPCHNGAFDASGKPTEGPPAAAGQELTRFPLKVEDGLLFIDAPLHSVSGSNRGAA